MSAAAVLTILKDGQTIKSQPLEGEALVGRSEACVIRLDDRAISRQHAVFRSTPEGVRVEKKSEFAPLSVNGAECTSAVVKEGDVIAMGPYLVRVSLGSGSGSSSDTDSVQTPTIDLDLNQEKASGEEKGARKSDAGSEVSLESAPSLELDASMPESLDPLAAPSSSDSPLEIQVPGESPASEPSIALLDDDAKTKLVASTKVNAKVVFPDGVANVKELEIDKPEIAIGRGKECEVVLDDKKTSRRHAVIRRDGVKFSLKDLESANGTFVNGAKIDEQELSGDDIIKIGNVEFRFLVLSADYVKNEQNFLPVQEEPAEISFPDADAAPGVLAAQSAQPVFDPGPMQPVQPASSAASFAGIPGIAGVGTGPKKKQSLFQKYRELPPRRKAIWTVIIIAALYFGLVDEEPVKHHPKPKTAVVGTHAPATFDNLTPEQKKFVEAQHQLAFDYYRNRDYDKAIFEVEKIFALIPDYEDSREIERYAKEGKRKLEAAEEEKHKQEEEARLKAQVAKLVADAKSLMDEKRYDEVDDLFSQILALDPDNQQVSDWRKTVEAYQEQKRIQDEELQVQQQINVRAWDLYKEGVSLKKQKKFADAIASFKRVFEIGASDKRVSREASERIAEIHKMIADLRDPVLADAHQAEDAQDYSKAYALYLKATQIDPSDSNGYAGMDRIRGILHERAKALYIQAVLAESYTDFDTAKKRYQDVLAVAPKDDPYHDRAERKLASFFNSEQNSGDGAGGAPGPGGGGQ